MLEPSPRRLPRARAGTPIARVAALCAAGLLALSTALPAAALGEDGPFPFPAETETLEMVPGAVTRIPLRSLIEDDLEKEVDLPTARLAVPQDLEEAVASRMQLGEDSRSLDVSGEGTWSLLGDELVFTPEYGAQEPLTPIALSVGGFHDSRSLPVVLTPEMLSLDEITVHGSAGEPTTLDLDAAVPEGGSLRLQLAGLPSGSTVDSAGSRVVIPDQGLWQLEDDGTALTHTPSGPGLGRQLDSVRYVIEDEEDAVVGAGRVTLTVPIISDLDWSAPYGEDILFVVGEGQQYVDPTTLRLQPQGDASSYDASTDGTRVVVHGQGTWVLDRSAATVRFTPEDDQVRETAPMGITGGDGEGGTAATALLSTAYPVLRSRVQAGTPGGEISIDMSVGIRDVSTDSLRFDPDAAPDGAELSEDDTVLRVPGEGTWRIDLATSTVVMTPEDDLRGAATPVGMTARGIYADNPVETTVQVIVTDAPATPRDDEGRTAPGRPVTVDVLSNDTAGSSARPLVPDSVRISSLSATNLSQLEDGRGTRLLIPGEGEYTVAENGAVTFQPTEGFTGRTTPITYDVADSEGVPVHASLTIDVDSGIAATEVAGPEVSGINSLLVGLMPSSPGTSVLFATIVLLLLFGGSISLWIGLRMETDRRTWED